MKHNMLAAKAQLLNGRINKSKKAQSSLEYTLIIAVFVAALISIQAYVKRGIQGNFRAIANDIGTPYEPKNTTSSKTISGKSKSVVKVTTSEAGDKLETKVTSEDASSDRTKGWEKVGPLP